MVEIAVGLITSAVVLLVLYDLLIGFKRKSSRKRAEQEIDTLDFAAVRTQLRDKLKWDISRAIDATNEYRKFLKLVLKHKGKTIVPWNDDLDLFWHQHILNTYDYEHMCKRIFGYHLHHTPGSDHNASALLAAARYTASLRRLDQIDSGPTRSQVATAVPKSRSSTKSSCGSCHTSSCSTNSCSSSSSCGSSCGGGGCGGD